MKTLVIDPGHGGADSGASAFGYYEKDLVLVIAKRVQELLKEYSPDITRTTDRTLANGDRTLKIRNKYKYCLSIHLNSFDGNARGVETIHSIHSVKGKELAEVIANNLTKILSIPLRRVFSRKGSSGNDFYFMHRNTGSTTTIIAEGMFMDNKDDIKELNVEKISQAIANGFKEFMGNEEPIKEKEDDKLEYTRLLRQGTKGEDVKKLQDKLTKIGFDTLGVDGVFGRNTKIAAEHFQSYSKLKVDGIVGRDTIKALNNSKKKVNNHYYKNGNTHVVEIDPLDLKISAQDKPGNSIRLDNYVTGGFQWHHANGVTYPLGILASENRLLSNRQPHGKPAGTLLVYRDGSVKVKDILNLNNESMVRFAVSGCSILPEVKMTSAGFVGPYSDVARKTDRPMLGYRKSDNKIIIAVANCDIYEARRIMMNLGCDEAITLDAGGSTILQIAMKLLVRTTRRLHSVITW